ncbi:MAG: hypothetical protein ABL967_01575 [Bryobacteraceae bacterium]
MDIREGMRRLSLVVGFLGGSAGGFLVYPEVKPTWDACMYYRNFSDAASLPTVQKALKSARAYRGAAHKLNYANGEVIEPSPPPHNTASKDTFWEDIEFQARGDKDVSINTDGISMLILDTAGEISSIHFSSGEVVQATVRPTFPFSLFLYPILGFFVPWAAIRTLTWIGEGFFRART